MAGMGLPLAYGAGVAPDQLAQIVKERLLIQEQQRRQAELEWQKQYQGGMLGIAQSREGRDAQMFGPELELATSNARVAKGTEAERVRIPGLTNRATEANIAQSEVATAGQRGENEDKARIRGLRTPEAWSVLAQPEPWQQFAPMPGGQSPFDKEQAAAMKRIQAQGAMQSSLQGPYLAQWDRITTDDKGRPVTKRFGQLRDGSIVELQSVGGKTTADIQNRKQYTQEFSKTLSTFESMIPFVKNYNMNDSWGERVVGATKGAAQEFAAKTPWGSAVAPQATYFMGLQEGLAMTGARVLGSNSQLSDKESERAQNALFPKLTESEEVQHAKIQFWKRASQIEDEAEQAQYIRLGLQGVFPGIAGITGGDRYTVQEIP